MQFENRTGDMTEKEISSALDHRIGVHCVSLQGTNAGPNQSSAEDSPQCARQRILLR